MARERTLLSSINDVKITRVIEIQPNREPVKVYVKNPKSSQNRVNNSAAAGSNGFLNGPGKEDTPSKNRAPGEFMEVGGKGDESLFSYDGDSTYSKNNG
jgi:serine/threonine-protein kinase Chk2